MCLLVFAWQPDEDHPLVVAANRDERLDRPARSACVLAEGPPRIVGGRDELAGGTWLATNEHGVVAGLTNRPSLTGRDTTKRSRGELPLLAAGQTSAAAAVAALVAAVGPDQYNPAWLLIGDRRSLFYVEIEADRKPSVEALDPGIHILENVSLGQASPKADRVRSLLRTAATAGRALEDALPEVLADHALPFGSDDDTIEVGGIVRHTATLACCVHTEEYGTRSAALVVVDRPDDALPLVRVADGPPCSAAFVDATAYWTA
jgi:uncharacterized protein with NRDE domain